MYSFQDLHIYFSMDANCQTHATYIYIKREREKNSKIIYGTTNWLFDYALIIYAREGMKI